MKTPILDIRIWIQEGIERGIVFNRVIMSRYRYNEIINSREFNNLWSKYYKKEEKTIIRVNKIMRKENLIKIIVYKA
jgi:hypothetical protein